MVRPIPPDACDGPYHGGGIIPPDDPKPVKRSKPKKPAQYKLTKQAGPQACDACGREFVAQRGDWICPHCGFDNVAGQEFGREFNRYCTERSAERARARREST